MQAFSKFKRLGIMIAICLAISVLVWLGLIFEDGMSNWLTNGQWLIEHSYKNVMMLFAFFSILVSFIFWLRFDR